MTFETFVRTDPMTVAFAGFDKTTALADQIAASAQRIRDALAGEPASTVPSHGECMRVDARDDDGWYVTWPCLYSGPVDVLLFPADGLAIWLCPVCGYENEVDPEVYL